jgi:hypothetical protein
VLYPTCYVCMIHVYYTTLIYDTILLCIWVYVGLCVGLYGFYSDIVGLYGFYRDICVEGPWEPGNRGTWEPGRLGEPGNVCGF